MSSDDWFRLDEWDEASRGHFEDKLQRAHRASRPQYLHIKGLALINSTDDARREAGAELEQRVIDHYSDDEMQAAGAHVALARYREETGEPARSAEHYRESMRLLEGSFGAELLLAELIIRHGYTESLEEADGLLDTVLESGPIFAVEQFRYAVARFRLARHRDLVDEAAAFALGALHLFATNRPISSYHPDVGLIRADDATLVELEEAAGQGNPEAVNDRIERFRGPDGRVRWEWALVSRLRGVEHAPRLQAQDEFDAAAASLVNELRAAGFEVYDLHEWSGQSLPDAASVRVAAPILLRALEAAVSPELKAAIASALTDRRFRKFATSALISEFRGMRSRDLNGKERPSEQVGRQRRLKDALANALATLARDEHFDEVVALIRDQEHGRYRSYLFWALPYMKDDRAVDVALEMLADDEVHMSALRALADLRSERARPVLEVAAGQPRPRGRSEADELARDRIDVAQQGLNKLTKARSNGKARR